jgi:hypothetical protein
LDENNIPVSKNPLEVNIYKVNNNSYKFISKMKGDDFYSEGEIETEIKNALQSSGWLRHQMTECTPHTTVRTGLVYGGSPN